MLACCVEGCTPWGALAAPVRTASARLPFASPLIAFSPPPPQSALIGLNAATVRAMRPKRRVLLVRFISKALLTPFYRQEWVEAPVPGEEHGWPGWGGVESAGGQAGRDGGMGVGGMAMRILLRAGLGRGAAAR